MKLQIIRTQGGFKNRTIDYPGNLYLPSYIKIKKSLNTTLKILVTIVSTIRSEL